MLKLDFGNDKNIIGEFIQGRVVVQSFLPIGKELIEIGINFGTYNRVNYGVLVVKILDSQDKNIFETQIDISRVLNNKFTSIFPNVLVTPYKKYYLLLYNPNINASYSITAKYGQEEPHDCDFFIFKHKTKGELCCFFKYESIEEEETFTQSLSFEGVPYEPNSILEIPLTDILEEKVNEDITEDEIENINSEKSNEIQIQTKIIKDLTLKGLISIIIPNKNDSQYIDSLLKSIQSQIYNNVEIIIVDDCSGKIEIEYLEQIINKYVDILNISLIKSEIPLGACGARNLGKTKAIGEYLFFCDADVTLDEYCLLELLDALHRNLAASWSYCNYHLGDTEKSFCNFDVSIIKKKNICSTMSLIRKEHFIEFDINFPRLQDWDLFLSMVEKGYHGIWVNKFLFNAIKRSTGITFGTIPWKDAIELINRKHKIKAI